MSDTPLKTLGKYQIRKELGKGAMGVVYLGFDPALEREVAIKVMAGATVSDPTLKKRFEDEAKAAARLQHGNIITVYDFGYDEQDAPYIAMEFLRGHDLEERIRAMDLSFREKLDVVVQTCRGLAHAHEHGVVHRDIKPANIFVTDAGEAKIMDFGVARLAQSTSTQTGTVLGTADYMSPEQVRGAKVDGRSDIFSAGVILFRLLTNKKPFAGDNIQAVFFKVLNEDPPALLLPDGNDIPELQAIVDKALSKRLDERYGTATDFADDIIDLMGLYEHVLTEETVFDTLFDPTLTPELDPGSDAGTGSRPATSSGRVLGTGSGISRTHRPGTAIPQTATGRTGFPRTSPGHTAAGRATAFGETRVAPGTHVGHPGTMSGTRTGVGIPVQTESGPWKYIAVGALALVAAAGVYFTTRPEAPAPTSTEVAQTAPADHTRQFELAERALEAGQLSTAVDALQSILFADPENPRALELQAQVQAAMDEMERAPEPAPAPAPVAQAAPPPAPRGPSNAERASELAADASLAIGNGDIARAQQLIQQGRGLDPSSPRWPQLDAQIRRSQQEAAEEQAAAQKRADVDTLLTQATNHLRAQQYDQALATYDRALEIDPTDARIITARQAAEISRNAATATGITIQESPTRYVGKGQTDTPKGFEPGTEVKVTRATSAPDNPAEVIIQIQPTTVQPGDPYNLRVRINNQGNRPIGVKDLEIVSTYGGRAQGRGHKLAPMRQRINPRETSVVYEVRGNWSEEQATGNIEVIVTLIGDARLYKTIQW